MGGEIDQVKRQICDLHNEGFEIALHLHPQWCNARYERGRWVLDDSEYNAAERNPKMINRRGRKDAEGNQRLTPDDTDETEQH